MLIRQLTRARLRIDARAFHHELVAELLLEERLHHRAATGVAKTNAKNFSHGVPPFEVLSVFLYSISYLINIVKSKAGPYASTHEERQGRENLYVGV